MTDVREYYYAKVVLHQTIQRNQELCSISNKDTRNQLHKQLTTTNNQLSKARENQTIDRFAAILHKPVQDQMNVSQNQI